MPGSPFLTNGGNTALAIDPKGGYLYVSGLDTGGLIDAVKINQTTGALTELPGSPYTIIPVTCAGCFDWEQFNDLTVDRTGNFLIGPGSLNGVIYVYRIDRNTGALSEVPGSPFGDEEPQSCESRTGAAPYSVTVQSTNNYVFVLNGGQANNIVAYRLNSGTGALTMDAKTWGPYPDWGYAFASVIRTDPSGSFVFALGQLGQPGTPFLIAGYMIDQSNGSLALVPNAPYPTYENNNTNALVITP